MKVYENKLYQNDINYIANLKLPWDTFRHKSFLISGGRGLLGSCMIDTLMLKNNQDNLDCRIYVLGRNIEETKNRFGYCWDSPYFSFVFQDINAPFKTNDFGHIDYVVHLASNTHPVAYSTDPIGTITTNILGTNNMMHFAFEHNAERAIFASSNEIYGENRGDVEFFEENYCGYIDSNTVRAGYPESKRCGEALCQSYIKQYGLDIVIPRFTRSYGPTMLMSDSKAISQFIRKGVYNEDVILKSKGTQYYSYTYVTDAVAGLFTVILKGKTGEAYNIADVSGDIMLKDLAAVIAEYVGKRVIFELPDEVEKAGYSTATKARLDGTKINSLGWAPRYGIKEGIYRTINILQSI